MKKSKKIILGLLAFVLSLGFMSNALANTTGTITINGTTEGKIYEIYKIFDLTYSGTNVSYTISTEWEDFFENDGEIYISDTDLGNLNQITIGSETKYINITNDNIETFTKDALVYASTLTGNSGSAKAEGTSLTFTNLDLGYYLVYPQGATDLLEGYGSICSITSTMPEATVNIKAGYPTIDKTVDDPNAEVGQLVEFKITGQVPDTTGYNTYTYTISDTMSSGLKFDIEQAQFTVTFKEDTISVEPTVTENGFTITFDMVQYQEYVGEEITITYKALVTEEAVNSSTTNNSVTLTYSNNPKENTTTTTPPIEVPVYSSEINVVKVDTENEELKLSGASFVLKNTENKYYQALDIEGNIITNTTQTQAVVDVNWVDTLEEATLLVTQEEGTITFEGIENGTYYLEEIEAPLGYNKLTGPVTLKIGYNEEGTNLNKVAVSHIETVKNNTGTELPKTGGIGTTLFIIIGSLLTLVSSVLLVANKRMAKGC